MEAEELKPQILATIDDLNQYLNGNVTALGLIDTMKDTINYIEDYAMTIREDKTMENLNEGKKKKASYMAELAEIDKQSSVVAMEAKINKLAEMVEAKNARLSMVSEDENLAELIDKKQVKMMEREIKEIERAKAKLESLYEKMTGGKKKEVVDEEEKMDEMRGMTSYEEDEDGMREEMRDDSMDEEMRDDSMDEEMRDDSMDEEMKEKEETNEEFNRFRKLAGL